MPASKHTKKADTPRRKRMHNEVRESARGQGHDEGAAIRIANAAVKKDKAKTKKKAKSRSRKG